MCGTTFGPCGYRVLQHRHHLSRCAMARYIYRLFHYVAGNYPLHCDKPKTAYYITALLPVVSLPFPRQNAKPVSQSPAIIKIIQFITIDYPSWGLQKFPASPSEECTKIQTFAKFGVSVNFCLSIKPRRVLTVIVIYNKLFTDAEVREYGVEDVVGGDFASNLS